MARRRSQKGKSSRSKKFSRLILFALVAVVIGLVYFINNSFSASVNDVAKVSESFEEVVATPSSYKIQLVDETGTAIKQDLLKNISVASVVSGKDCGPKGSTKTHPNGGCFVIDKPSEVPITIASDATASFQNKLYHINQIFEYSDKKQKQYNYYFSGIGSGTNFIAWKTNTIIIKSANGKSEIARIPINSNVNLQKDLTKATSDIVNFNSSVKTIKIPTDKITSVLTTDAGTPVAVATTTTVTVPAVVVPVLSANAISSGSISVKFAKSVGGDIIPGQNYQVYNWYSECTVTVAKKSSCTKSKKYYGEKGVAGTDGTAKFKTELINIGNEYFIGQNISDDKFRVWNKSEIVALNTDGRKIVSKVITSAFYGSSMRFLIIKSISATQRDKNKQKMIDKYNKFLQKEYIIKAR